MFSRHLVGERRVSRTGRPRECRGRPRCGSGLLVHRQSEWSRARMMCCPAHGRCERRVGGSGPAERVLLVSSSRPQAAGRSRRRSGGHRARMRRQVCPRSRCGCAAVVEQQMPSRRNRNLPVGAVGSGQGAGRGGREANGHRRRRRQSQQHAVGARLALAQQQRGAISRRGGVGRPLSLDPSWQVATWYSMGWNWW
jgi:hypothetical protein